MTDEKDPLAEPGHLFDQTNGMADGLSGDSDGTAGAEEQSAADREDEADTAAGTGTVA